MVQVTNACYISLFDKSDEALVNDYEDILQLLSEDDSALAGIFNTLIDDFIHKNPASFNQQVENEWDDTPTSQKLVFTSPIPLNSEQLQILSAVRKNGCKYITVEGPPGTGKSHSITAIVFDAILKNQSVLVLSDKKEALDVVEDKITSTMRAVRTDDRFQNPILRLGKIGSNYSQILSTTAIGDIKNHYRAVRKGYDKVKENISKIGNTLHDDLEAEILAYHGIDLREIHELIQIELEYESNGYPFNISELVNHEEPATAAEELRQILLNIRSTLGESHTESGPRRLLMSLGIPLRSIKTLNTLLQVLQCLGQISDNVKTVRGACAPELHALSISTELRTGDVEILKEFVNDYAMLKHWLFGYALKRKQLESLDKRLLGAIPSLTISVPHEHIADIQAFIRIYEKTNEIWRDRDWFEQLDYLRTSHQFLTNAELLGSFETLLLLSDDLNYLDALHKRLPVTCEELGIDVDSLESVIENKLIKIEEAIFNRLVRYLDVRNRILRAFRSVPLYNYTGAMKELQEPRNCADDVPFGWPFDRFF